MYIFDTLSKEKKKFTPLEPGKVGFYHCGPTVYWNQHIGNMRAVALADFMRRSFEYLEYDVTFVRNYTDVGHLSGDNAGDADTGEDRMEKAAKRENKSPDEIADHYIGVYEEDTSKLNTLSPTHTTRATHYIQEMIDMVQTLLDKGYAYQTDLAIYFDISKKQDYTKLSRQDLDALLSGAGHGDVSDSDKKNIGDFSLWFFKAGAHVNALQTWKNPFSEVDGFPGWHIECSAMSKKYLGETFDVHMGGIEHIPIHHTNEIAQSESANGKPFVNYWVHNEHLLVDNKKMSKSEGTSYLIFDIENKGFSALDLRYFFLQAHYRSKQNFTWEALEAAKSARTKLHSKIASYADGGSVNAEFQRDFKEALGADFGLPEALAVTYSILSSDINDTDKKATILDFDSVLGLKLDEALEGEEFEIPQEVAKLLLQRKNARNEKDWTLSDTLRDEIDSHGFEVKDESEGQVLYKKT